MDHTYASFFEPELDIETRAQILSTIQDRLVKMDYETVREVLEDIEKTTKDQELLNVEEEPIELDNETAEQVLTDIENTNMAIDEIEEADAVIQEELKLLAKTAYETDPIIAEEMKMLEVPETDSNMEEEMKMLEAPEIDSNMAEELKILANQVYDMESRSYVPLEESQTLNLTEEENNILLKELEELSRIPTSTVPTTMTADLEKEVRAVIEEYEKNDPLFNKDPMMSKPLEKPISRRPMTRSQTKKLDPFSRIYNSLFSKPYHRLQPIPVYTTPMTTREARLKTFPDGNKRWAEAGFVWKRTYAECFKCKLQVVYPSGDKDPITMHMRYSPNCSFIQKLMPVVLRKNNMR